MNIKKYNVQYVDNKGLFEVFIDGELYDSFETLVEAQDSTEDRLHAELKEQHKYVCDFCQEYYDEHEVDHRIEDNSFTAPYGSVWVMGKDICSVPVCPICGDDMEEC